MKTRLLVAVATAGGFALLAAPAVATPAPAQAGAMPAAVVAAQTSGDHQVGCFQRQNSRLELTASSTAQQCGVAVIRPSSLLQRIKGFGFRLRLNGKTSKYSLGFVDGTPSLLRKVWQTPGQRLLCDIASNDEPFPEDTVTGVYAHDVHCYFHFWRALVNGAHVWVLELDASAAGYKVNYFKQVPLVKGVTGWTVVPFA